MRIKALNDERYYEDCLTAVADKVNNDRRIQLLLVAGGSCAGKTTTTKKLTEMLTQRGMRVESISLDDYYRNHEESVFLPDGRRDIETPASLRLDLINQTIEDISAGKETSVPYFDFVKERRIDNYRSVKVESDSVALVEGLHALNPLIYGGHAKESELFRVYLYADSGDTYDARFIRRLVRDSRYRNADAARTFSLWDEVQNNEIENIIPHSDNADMKINTFFEYEKGVLCTPASELLKALPMENPHIQKAIELIKTLETIQPLTHDDIPQNSLLTEFI